MVFWDVEQDADGVVVAAYRNEPTGYFTGEAAGELGELIGQWADPSVRAVVLCGAHSGRFITHYSVEELLAYAADRAALPEISPQLTGGFHALLVALSGLPKPVIVAMTGDTMGGGFEISLWADIRIAEDADIRIGLPETRLGILPGGSGTQRLSRLVGAGQAIEIILRGRVFTPAEALARGLVHEVAADSRARAVELARELARSSAVALAQAKRAVWQGADRPLAEGLELESDAFLQTMLSDEALEAMQRYVDTPYEERRRWFET